jgi:hypothetical protein
MNHLRINLRICILTAVALAGAGAIWAQDEPQEPPPESAPKPAGQSMPGVDTGQDQNANQNNQIQPDDTPLTGMLTPTLGSPEIQHSYVVAGLQYASSIQSSGYGNSSWFDYNYAAANVSLLEAWSHSKLVLNYSGGGYFSSESGYGSGAYQVLSYAQAFDFNRWKFQIQDSFSYSPQSVYGFGGGTNLGIAGVGGGLGPTTPGIGNTYVPNVSLYAGLGPQYSNIGVLQGTYAVTPRGSITVSAGYGILNFIDPGFVDTDSLFTAVGYNYQLTRKDTIGAFYEFSSYHFPGDPQAYGSQIASLAYSRKITGRLALSLHGGPQYNSFRIPIGTSSGQFGWYASGSLGYSLERGSISASYNHGLSGGGGLLVGSTFDQVNLNASRSLTRVWTGNVNFGFANNKSILTSPGVFNPSYRSWYAGGGVSRHFGRSVTLGLSYTASISSYSLPTCPGTTCGPSSNSLYQTINVSVQWRTRPFVLR